MAALYLSLTDAGLAAVQAASGTDPVTIAELGLTATPFTVAPTLTALPGEFKRIGAVAGTAAAANVTHMTAYDTSSDVWNATGLGLWLGDGTLFAVYSSASTIINKAAPAFALIGFDIAFNADLAGSIAFGDPLFTNPPATEDNRGLIEVATQGEANAGGDPFRALTPATAKIAVTEWLNGRDLQLGVVNARTPDLGTTGGFRLLGNLASGYAFQQILSHDAGAQWGYWRYSAGGEADWHGAGGLKLSGNLVWHAGNDGAGSGSDADLLDGQQGSWYADIAGRLGYTPLPAAGYTAGDVRDKLLTVDGSGSGVDADMLDGQHLSQIAPAGIVALWPVSRGAIPAGWHIMDGTNGTDDWRDKFVMSAGPTHAAGSTGGAALHNHAVTIDPAATGLTIAITTATVNGDGDPPNALTSAVLNDPTHSHAAATANASSLPPYVVAYYIQKL